MYRILPLLLLLLAASVVQGEWNTCGEKSIAILHRSKSGSASGKLSLDQLECVPADVHSPEEIMAVNSSSVLGLAVLGVTSEGWQELSIWTNSNGSSAAEQGIAAGFLEASVTGDEIVKFVSITERTNFADYILGPSAAIKAYISEQITWARQESTKDSSPSSVHLQLILGQLDGMVAGLAALGNKDAMTIERLALHNAVGDISDLLPKYHRGVRPNYATMTPEEIELAVALRGHCSAAVRLTSDHREIFSGHSTWSSYGYSARIFKHYHFGVAPSDPHISFSSYPGLISSLDDFYQMHHTNMVMLETTNGLHNWTLYDTMTPLSLLAWQRVRIACAVADTGKEWFETFAPANSGTYNNQYIIIDYKLFTPGAQDLPDNLLWVIEQMPGLVVGEDQTQLLRNNRYYSSYNVPFYASIANASGWTKFAHDHGPDYSYPTAPRGRIFQTIAPYVETLDHFKAMLRHNNYTLDPISHGNPWRAICSRGDLHKPPIAAGCTDTKVTSGHLMSQRAAEGINGPTTAGGDAGLPIAPFKWSFFKDWVPHESTPHEFAFNFTQFASPL